MHPPSSCSKGSMRQPQTPLHLPRGWHAVCLVYVSGINSRRGDLLLIILINLCCWNPSKSCKWFALLCVQVGADHFRFLVQWQGHSVKLQYCITTSVGLSVASASGVMVELGCAIHLSPVYRCVVHQKHSDFQRVPSLFPSGGLWKRDPLGMF